MRNCLRCNAEMLEDATLHGRDLVVLKGGLGNFGMFDKFTLKGRCLSQLRRGLPVYRGLQRIR